MSDKNKKPKKMAKAASSESFRTQQTLSKGNTETTFYNLLRTGDPSNGHVETKLAFVPIKVNKRRDQVSHIFTGEDPSTIKESRKKQLKHLVSNVVFNDSYVEKNPKINPRRRARYEFEERIKKNQQYSDELILSDRRKKLLQRKINDNYMNNPMKILNKQEREQYNKEYVLRNQRHMNAVSRMYNSKSCKRILGGIKSYRLTNRDQVGKITKNNFNITQRAEYMNKNEDNQVPYYGRRYFRFASCGKQGGLVYLD